MIDLNIVYLEVSPEVPFDSRRGYIVKLAYQVDADEDFMNSDLVKYCDFVEEIVFRLEWKRKIDGKWILIESREQKAYPAKRFQFKNNVVRSGEAFLDNEFLKRIKSFPEAAELFLRITMAPILSTKRRSLDIQVEDNKYRLSPAQIGDDSAFEGAEKGYEF